MNNIEIQNIENFLSTLSPSDHHLEHYNHFVLYELPEFIHRIIARFENKDCKIEINFENVYVDRASFVDNGKRITVYPEKCRKDDLYYSAPVYATIIQKKTPTDGPQQITVVNKAIICDVPVMVGSVLCNSKLALKSERVKECPKDTGGYFIVNGIERVLVTQIIGAYNIPQVLKVKNTLRARLRSMSTDTCHQVLIQCSVSIQGKKTIAETICIHLPYISKPIPLAIFFGALDIRNVYQVYDGIDIKDSDLKNELILAFESVAHMTVDDCLQYIGQYGTKKAPIVEDVSAPDIENVIVNEEEEDDISIHEDDNEDDISISDISPIETKDRQRAIAYARQVLDTELFPHLGICAPKTTILDSVYFMLKNLFLVRIGTMLPSEKDNLINKRFESAGTLLLSLYTICFKHFLNMPRRIYTGNNLIDYISKLAAFISKTVKGNMSTGQWGIQKNAYVKQGVSQVLSRLSYVGTLSHLQRLAIPMGKEGKNTKIRQIHPSQFGYICLYETPEGKPCGIVNNMTISARITRSISTAHLRDIVIRLFKFAAADTPNCVDVWLNNTFKYKIIDPYDFMTKFKIARARGLLSKYINIYFDDITNVVHINSDGGRITRPLYDRTGQIVWLDPGESQHAQIAMYPNESIEFEYCEIHPCLLYGIAAGCLPFSDHNQSPRNVYAASMIKQALGIFSYNTFYRYDSTCEIMYGVQRTLVSTAIARSVDCQDLQAGLNCVVAIVTANSWNAEDSLVFKKEAIERGMFGSFTFKTITVEEYKKKSTIVKKFCRPSLSARRPELNYDLLDENGIVRIGSFVQKKDIIVGREYMSNDGVRDYSEQAVDAGTVERVEVYKNTNGYKVCKIVLKIYKIPEQGDKFANMCAQKGTIGKILPQEDMPFTSDGMIPDIAINPNALPSRMTISMLLEMVLGKYGALSGTLIDATPFTSNSTNIIDKLCGLLSSYGFEDTGLETMYCGTTGDMLRTRVFMGISYYQKLKHMVGDKMHARAQGMVTTLTRQPHAGRKRDGGLRIGEMERDCIIANGACSFLTTRLFELSDAFYVYVCNNCRILSNHKDECHLCHNTHLIHTRLSFASKLFFSQLTACLISCKMTSELL